MAVDLDVSGVSTIMADVLDTLIQQSSSSSVRTEVYSSGQDDVYLRNCSIVRNVHRHVDAVLSRRDHI